MTLKGTRTCRKCKNIKTLPDFEEYKRKYGHAHRVVCKECVAKAQDITSLCCQDCKVEKLTKYFPKSHNALIGYEMTCKECKRVKQIASGKFDQVNRDRKGRYQSDSEF
jgi:hypothetical protein